MIGTTKGKARAGSRLRRRALTPALSLALGVALAAALGGSGCREDKPEPDLVPPTAVAAVNGDDIITIRWTSGPERSRSDFQGYSIYRWTSSLADTAPARLEPYRVGTAQGSAFSFADNFRLTNGRNGVIYYYHVRSRGDDISDASNEAQAAGRPEGTGMVIGEFAGSLASGFGFALGDSIRLEDPESFTKTDFYLGTTAPDNADSSPLALKSPHTLEGLDSRWGAVITGIAEIGMELADWELTRGIEPAGEASLVARYHVYAFRTPSGNYAKIQITGISGQPGRRIITFRYAYQTSPGLYLF